MLRFDGTGPWGAGPGSGWGMGPCGCGGRWWRKDGSSGMGWRRFYSKGEERENIESEIKVMEEDLQALKERLEELKAQGK